MQIACFYNTAKPPKKYICQGNALMLAKGWAIYKATRKKNDVAFNVYVMRPLAGQIVAIVAPTKITPNQVSLANLIIFVVAAAVLVAYPTTAGGIAAVALIEASYALDCADGMLARHKKIASQAGHLFDFFIDETKALLLTASLGLRLWRSGGLGIDVRPWAPNAPGFLVAGVVATAAVAGALSLTNFVRRPELTGQQTPVEAHYETVAQTVPRSLVHRMARGAIATLQFVAHYPSHIWLFAIADRLDVLFWLYALVHVLYLGRGWLGLLIRFGRF